MEFKLTTIVLDKERHLKLTMRGINEFQQVTGSDLMTVTDLQDLSPRELGVLIWACLIWEDKELKPEQISGIIESVDAKELMTALLECLSNSLPEAKSETTPLVVEPDGSNSGHLEDITSNSPKFLSGN